MKNKMIIAIALIALSTIGLQKSANAQRTRVAISAPLPGGGQLSVRTGNTNYGYNNYDRRYNNHRYRNNNFNNRRYQQRTVWVPGHWEFDRWNRRFWRDGYYAQG